MGEDNGMIIFSLSQKPVVGACKCVAMAESQHMQNRTGPAPPPGSSLIITHKVGQDVVVTAAILPQGHNLWKREINMVNHP